MVRYVHEFAVAVPMAIGSSTLTAILIRNLAKAGQSPFPHKTCKIPLLWSTICDSSNVDVQWNNCVCHSVLPIGFI